MAKKLNKNLFSVKKCSCILSFAVLLFTTACSNRHTPEGIFDNYLYRLHNSLEAQGKKVSVDANVANAIKHLPRYPQRTTLLHPLSESKINLLEFLRLSQCDLQRHIGERNSSLGKLQKDSQRLIYDIEFIRLAKICIDSLALDNPLREVLHVATADKEKQLPLLLWNATFASEEFIHLFSLSTNTISAAGLADKPVNLYEALDAIERMVKEENFVQSDFENALAVIASRKYLGEIRRSIVLVKEGLSQADNLLRYRIDQKPLCRSNTPNAKFDIVNNVFRKFYIGEVQPYIATVYQQAELSLESLEQLIQLQKTPSDFDGFWSNLYRADNSEWQQLKRAIEKHTEHWQALLEQCGSLPQA